MSDYKFNTGDTVKCTEICGTYSSAKPFADNRKIVERFKDKNSGNNWYKVENNEDELSYSYAEEDLMFAEDIVNHPKHYNREGAMQCLEEMELIFGKDAVMTFCLLNTWKYRYRAADKNGAEDISKSDFYMNYYKKLKES